MTNIFEFLNIFFTLCSTQTSECSKTTGHAIFSENCDQQLLDFIFQKVFLLIVLLWSVFSELYFSNLYFLKCTRLTHLLSFVSLFKSHYEEKTSSYLGNFLLPKADNLRQKSKTNKISRYIYDFCCGAKAEWVLCRLERIGNYILTS